REGRSAAPWRRSPPPEAPRGRRDRADLRRRGAGTAPQSSEREPPDPGGRDRPCGDAYSRPGVAAIPCGVLRTPHGKDRHRARSARRASRVWSIASLDVHPAAVGGTLIRLREDQMKDVNGKVAVVTGAASGIGRGMCEAFVQAGMRVVLADVEQKALERTTQTLRAGGADVHAVVTDVSKPAQVEALAAETLRRYGAVHVVCNNAGVAAETMPSWSGTLDDWNWVLGVNLMGVIYGVRTFLPILINQGAGGHIVNTASLAGLVTGGDTPYALSKVGGGALAGGL